MIYILYLARTLSIFVEFIKNLLVAKSGRDSDDWAKALEAQKRQLHPPSIPATDRHLVGCPRCRREICTSPR